MPKGREKTGRPPGRPTLQEQAADIARSGGAPDPMPQHSRDMGPILARWPVILHYDRASGELWKRFVFEARDPESLDRREYVATRPRATGNYLRIDGFSLPAARVVWLLHHGEWPEGKLARRDGDLFNDRIENLYLPSRPEPVLGRPRIRPPGVSRFYDRWQASGDLGNGRKKYLGRFQTIEEAIAARKAWDDASDLL